MLEATITSKGQITIPAPVRRALHLKEQDRLEFEIQGDAVLVKPVRETMLDLYGALNPKKRPVTAASKQTARAAAQREMARRWAAKAAKGGR